jgi:hypothetical protein
MNKCYNIVVVVKVATAVRGGGVSFREQQSSSRSRRGGASKNWTEGATAARLFFRTAVAIAIAPRPFKFHEISVSISSSSFVSSTHSFAPHLNELRGPPITVSMILPTKYIYTENPAKFSETNQAARGVYLSTGPPRL